MKHNGFIFNDGDVKRRIYFIDGRGKDISFNRWRVTLYYDGNFAATHFLTSEIEYNSFIKRNSPACYGDYSDFRDDADKYMQCGGEL
jgi:hypothetical protein